MSYVEKYSIVKHYDGDFKDNIGPLKNSDGKIAHDLNGKVYCICDDKIEYHSLLARIGRFVKGALMVFGTLGLILINKQKREEIHSYFFESVSSITHHMYQYNSKEKTNEIVELVRSSADIQIIKKRCKELNFSINFDISEQREVFFEAALTKNLAAIEFFISKHKGDVTSKKNVCTALLHEVLRYSFSDYKFTHHFVSPEQLYEIVKKFIELGADINQVNKFRHNGIYETVLTKFINYLESAADYYHLFDNDKSAKWKSVKLPATDSSQKNTYTSSLLHFAPLLSLLFSGGAKTNEEVGLICNGTKYVDNFVNSIKYQPQFLAILAGFMDQNSSLHEIPHDLIKVIASNILAKF